MKTINFSLRELQYFVSAAKHLHIGRAADECFVSQPTLSTQLKKLESQLGVDLFERNGKRIALTSAGQALKGQAETLLRSSYDFSKNAENYHDPFRGELNIGIIPTICPYLLPTLLPAIQASMPNLTVQWHEVQSALLVSQVNSGELDAGILALPYPTEALEKSTLFSEPFFALLNASHPLMKNQHISSADIASQPLLLLDEGHCLREHALSACQFKTNLHHQVTRATSLETIRALINHNQGISLFPKMALSNSDNYRPLKDKAAKRDIGMCWRASSPQKLALDEIRKLLISSHHTIN